ncbi:hypothetical protein BDN70DRAFT_913540 [Pholiota conissans]|uniref:Uncharacterized protein n=1 Tax=Pholiota conissans TaxID=109636 RepID=A0A9P5Z0Q0_9AGAR|nr:hypothetical protein BDN70DRAFT_913540 [Pholiota conissans]
MPPTLRSSNSARSSPVSSKSLSANVPHSANNTPSTTPTRKAPQCSKCGRPRAGHPRSGCPFADSPPPKKLNLAAASHLTDAMGSMVLDTPGLGERDEDSKAFIRNRRRKSAQPVIMQSESLMSLSTNSKEIVERLSQPGVFDDTLEEGKGKASRIVRWQETILDIPNPAKKKMMAPARSSMPCTLIPPTPESSFVSSRNDSFLKMESPSANSIQPLSDEDEDEPDTDQDQDQEEHVASSHGSSASTATRRPRPLERTMSADERDIFISKLSGEASATIYIIPKADVDAILTQARNLKFIAELVMNEDAEDPNALIILGRDKSAVQALVRKVETENRKAEATKSRSSALRTAAGAAVVGAVGAWAGLAFT